MEKRVLAMQRYQRLFELEITPFPELEALLEDVDLKHRMWTALRDLKEWDEVSARCVVALLAPT